MLGLNKNRHSHKLTGGASSRFLRWVRKLRTRRQGPGGGVVGSHSQSFSDCGFVQFQKAHGQNGPVRGYQFPCHPTPPVIYKREICKLDKKVFAFCSGGVSPPALVARPATLYGARETTASLRCCGSAGSGPQKAPTAQNRCRGCLPWRPPSLPGKRVVNSFGFRNQVGTAQTTVYMLHVEFGKGRRFPS